MTLDFDGQPIPFKPGESVAAALYRSGVKSWRTTRGNGRPRGLFCGIGVCFDCLITVDGERNQRACLVPAQDGLELSSDAGLPTSDEGEVALDLRPSTDLGEEL